MAAALVISLAMAFGGSGPAGAGHAPIPADPAATPTAANKMTVYGSAWITMKSGDSQILRGMRVYIVSPGLNNSEEIWSPVLDELGRGLEGFKRLEALEGTGKTLQSVATDQRKRAELLTSQIMAMRAQSRVPTERAYQAIRNALVLATDGTLRRNTRELVRKDEAWPKLMATAILSTGYTDGSGKFELTGAVPTGAFIYASHSTDSQIVEWLVPIESVHGGAAKVDLFNENVANVVEDAPDWR